MLSRCLDHIGELDTLASAGYNAATEGNHALAGLYESKTSAQKGIEHDLAAGA